MPAIATATSTAEQILKNDGEYEKFRETAKIMLNMPIIVQSTANFQMRKEISGYLKKTGSSEGTVDEVNEGNP